MASPGDLGLGLSQGYEGRTDLGFMKLLGTAWSPTISPALTYTLCPVRKELLTEGCAPPKGKDTWGPRK